MYVNARRVMQRNYGRSASAVPDCLEHRRSCEHNEASISRTIESSSRAAALSLRSSEIKSDFIINAICYASDSHWVRLSNLREIFTSCAIVRQQAADNF